MPILLQGEGNLGYRDLPFWPAIKGTWRSHLVLEIFAPINFPSVCSLSSSASEQRSMAQLVKLTPISHIPDIKPTPWELDVINDTS